MDFLKDELFNLYLILIETIKIAKTFQNIEHKIFELIFFFCANKINFISLFTEQIKLENKIFHNLVKLFLNF